EGLDSGLLGTALGETPAGRPPVEAVETGHVGLSHRTRRGDQVRAWYRGPLVPHPTVDPSTGRLPLAHASDQLRIVVPDGREDLSLAAAFDIGRLLALSRPAMIAALMRFRQMAYQAARRDVIWQAQAPFLEALGLDVKQLAPNLGVLLGRGLARSVAKSPGAFLGAPRPLAGPGRPLPLKGTVAEHLAAGFSLPKETLLGGPEAVLANLTKLEAPFVPLPGFNVRRGPLAAEARVGREALVDALDHELARLVADTLPALAAPEAGGGPARRGAKGAAGKAKAAKGGAKAARRPKDALDRLLDALEAGEESE
ncbi:MAG TPA: hypothetical protein VFS00_22720, partial [Polyangiaceae bacterium]|nr:hypothetical protein [Polyangiaceae bacterium]